MPDIDHSQYAVHVAENARVVQVIANNMQGNDGPLNSSLLKNVPGM
jgi:hypothetical protein